MDGNEEDGMGAGEGGNGIVGGNNQNGPNVGQNGPNVGQNGPNVGQNGQNSIHTRPLTITNNQFLTYLNSIMTETHHQIEPGSRDGLGSALGGGLGGGTGEGFVSLQILNQLADLQPFLSQTDPFLTPSIPTSSFSTPHLQFLYKQNTNSTIGGGNNVNNGQSNNNKPGFGQPQSQQNQQPPTSTTTTTTKPSTLTTTSTPFTTRQLLQIPVPSSSSAAFKQDPTQQSNQFTRLDNQLRFFGFTFDYHYITFGFSFQLSHHIEVRLYKICQVLVDKPNIGLISKQQQDHQTAKQQAAVTNAQAPKRRVGRPRVEPSPASLHDKTGAGAATHTQIVDLTKVVDGGLASVNTISGQLSHPFAAHYLQHNLTPAPAGLIEPYVHIAPVVNAQWMCEIRGLAVQAKLSELEMEMGTIKQLIVDQINIYQ